MENSKNLRKVAFPVPFDPFFLPNQCYGLHTIIDMGQQKDIKHRVWEDDKLCISNDIYTIHMGLSHN